MDGRMSVLALAALVGIASGQGVRIVFTASTTSAFLTDPIVWTVSAELTGYDDPTAYFGGFEGDFVPRHDGKGLIWLFENLLAHGEPPTIFLDIVWDLAIFNSAAQGTDDPSNPIDIARFTILYDALAHLGFGIHAYTAIGTAWVYPNNDPSTAPDLYTGFEVRTDWVWVGGAGLWFWGCTRADLAEPYGVHDINDVTTFLHLFREQDGSADIAEPLDVLDLNDVRAFVEIYLAGCDFP